MNCLRAGYIAEKCRTPSMCKKCTRRHHTLLHRDANNSMQKKPNNAEGKEEAHVAALRVSEQVLLMTFKVKVTAPNGFSTIARALIDPESSTSFVHERIVQLLHCRVKMLWLKELEEPLRLHEGPNGSESLALTMMQRKFG